VAELIVGRVLAVDDHPGARAPSYLLRVDLGGRGAREAQMDPGDYAKDELVGTLVILSLDDEAIVLAAHSHAGLRLVRPDGDVEPGTVVA
jgi:tRNA-binding EMAP/Myf-like protein